MIIELLCKNSPTNHIFAHERDVWWIYNKDMGSWRKCMEQDRAAANYRPATEDEVSDFTGHPVVNVKLDLRAILIRLDGKVDECIEPAEECACGGPPNHVPGGIYCNR
jgi:hypothetical protein